MQGTQAMRILRVERGRGRGRGEGGRRDPLVYSANPTAIDWFPAILSYIIVTDSFLCNVQKTRGIFLCFDDAANLSISIIILSDIIKFSKVTLDSFGLM